MSRYVWPTRGSGDPKAWLPTGANGQPAAVAFVGGPHGNYQAHGVVVLTVPTKVSARSFRSATSPSWTFGLPPVLQACSGRPIGWPRGRQGGVTPWRVPSNPDEQRLIGRRTLRICPASGRTLRRLFSNRQDAKQIICAQIIQASADDSVPSAGTRCSSSQGRVFV